MTKKGKKTGGGSSSSGSRGGGYGNPPEHSRFKKGVSGNRNGRPPGAKNKVHVDTVLGIIEKESRREIKVSEAGKAKSMPTLQAILRGIFIAAANGNPRAQKLAVELSMEAENRALAWKEIRFTAAHELKASWAEASKLRRQKGLPDPDVFPHPDHIHLDYETGEVTVNALTVDQERLLHMYFRMKSEFEVHLTEILAADHDSKYLPDVMDEIRYIVRVIKGASANVGVPWAEESDKSLDLDEMSELIEKVLSELKKR